MNIKQLEDYISTLPKDAEIVIRLRENEQEYRIISSHLVGRTNIFFIDVENLEDDY